MPSLSVTYSFTNGTAADASAVNTNFTDVINGTSNGTIDFAINALSCAGAVTLNNNTTIGNASSDDLTITASLASSIPIKTTRSYDIGSADLGLRILYLGMNSTHTIALCAPSSGASADYTLELPATVGVIGQGIVKTSASATTWAPAQYTTNAVSSADYTILDNDGYSLIDVTTGSTTRTVTLPTLADNVGRVLIISKADSGTGFVTIDGENAETINGAATKTLLGQYDFLTIKGFATEWRIISDGRGQKRTACTPTGSWANTTYSGFFRLVGGNEMEFWFKAAVTGVISGGLTFTLPNSWAADTAVMLNSSTEREPLGWLSCYDGSDIRPQGLIMIDSSTVVRAMYYDPNSSTNHLRASEMSNTAPVTINSGDEVYAYFRLPITGI